ncbi:late competence development ComFB family protein [Clostridium sp. 'White wine YQ']|uniref:late competence development ComFB family protein n=1 Tax=Clostridium sp. 'White wine YQ' TaxID=3027474 RepID=UPI002365984D|nr:late competence development ComFB family protein [Clostridium sp. 'White wine YQ']MDD7795442.1 late competence development ComFB family protein [Clostridium sp. 'White wine YQ']
MIKNCMEDIVNNVITTVLDDYKDICKCGKCVDDIKAIALNNLKPLYAVTSEGMVYSKMKELENQFRIDVINQLINATEMVLKNPKH